MKLPLLIIAGSKGFLACGYINVETCNKTEKACTIASGVKTHEDMLNAEVKFVSERAKEIGVKEGMMGFEAIDLMR
ncbi:MAG: YunC family protein [Deltaproteobacteria bacterium]|nr:YunC family protein [Deltaproteobacteria bacterium]